MKDGVEKTSVDFASKDQKTHSQTNITSRAPGGTGPSTSKELHIYRAVAVSTVLLVLIVAVLVHRHKKSTGSKQSPPKCAEDPDTIGSPGQGEPTQRLSYDQASLDLPYIYKRVGDSLNLKCNNVLKGYGQCISVTWLYGRNRSGTIDLRWSDQGTSDQMSQQETPGQCVVRRPNRQPLDSAGLRCLLMKDGVEKTSVDFASKDQKTHSQTNITSGAPGGKGPSTSKEHFIYLAVAMGTVLLVLIVAVLVLRRKKSTGNKQSPPMCAEDPDTTGSPGQGEPTQRLSYDQGEPDGGLLYASIEHRTGSGKARPPSVEEGGCGETVTYSTVSKPPANVPEHSCSR
ncbi:unnamed protein product [Gadus morhua 'NCC']